MQTTPFPNITVACRRRRGLDFVSAVRALRVGRCEEKGRPQLGEQIKSLTERRFRQAISIITHDLGLAVFGRFGMTVAIAVWVVLASAPGASM